MKAFDRSRSRAACRSVNWPLPAPARWPCWHYSHRPRPPTFRSGGRRSARRRRCPRSKAGPGSTPAAMSAMAGAERRSSTTFRLPTERSTHGHGHGCAAHSADFKPATIIGSTGWFSARKRTSVGAKSGAARSLASSSATNSVRPSPSGLPRSPDASASPTDLRCSI